MVDDRIDLGTAFKLLSGEKPMATCPKDAEPLISTFRFYKAEFFCMACGRTYGFLAPRPTAWTQELQDRHDILKRAFKTLCAQVDAAKADFEHEFEKLRRVLEMKPDEGLIEALASYGSSTHGQDGGDD